MSDRNDLELLKEAPVGTLHIEDYWCANTHRVSALAAETLDNIRKTTGQDAWMIFNLQFSAEHRNLKIMYKKGGVKT